MAHVVIKPVFVLSRDLLSMGTRVVHGAQFMRVCMWPTSSRHKFARYILQTCTLARYLQWEGVGLSLQLGYANIQALSRAFMQQTQRMYGSAFF